MRFRIGIGVVSLAVALIASSAHASAFLKLKSTSVSPGLNPHVYADLNANGGWEENRHISTGVYNANIQFLRYPGADPYPAEEIAFWDSIDDQDTTPNNVALNTAYNVGGFCIDLGQYWTTAYREYNVSALSTAPLNQYLPTGMGTAKAKQIYELLGRYLPTLQDKLAKGTDAEKNGYAAVMQACVWEIVSESATTLSLTSDYVKVLELPTDYQDLAATWLSTIDGDANYRYKGTIVALVNADNQDFALYVGGLTGGTVPEPLTMASAFLAIGGLGAYIRRRTGRAVA